MGSWRGRVLRVVVVLGTLAGVNLVALSSASAATGLDVYIGYMDTHTVAKSSNQPSPWPYTDLSRFIGTPCPGYGTAINCWDASALRLVNTGTTDVTGVHVVVTMGSHSPYDLWGSNLTVPAGSDLVLTETGTSPNSENFDGSDFSPNAYNGGLQASCANSGAYPVVSVTIAGATTTYTDTGQVLNAGGVDGGHCENGTFVPGRMDESHPWVKIGTAASGGGGGQTTTPPTAPQSLRAAAGDGSVTLSWSAPSSDGGAAVTGYRVYRGTTAGGESATALATVAGTGFTDKTAANGTTYYYKVVAVNSAGASPTSNEVSATPQAAPAPPPPSPQPPPPPAPQPPPPASTVPTAPLGLTATGVDGGIRLSWSKPASDGGASITGYAVYRGTAAGTESSTPIADGLTGTGFTDTDVSVGVTYYYTVAALNPVGASASSAEVQATAQSGPVPPPPPAPGGICAGLPGCHVVAHADINGDGHRDVVALARHGGHAAHRGTLVLRVRTGPGQVVQARRPLENWTGSPWVGVTRLDRRPGKEIMLGRLSGAAASFYQSITWRHGRLVLLDAPGRGRWWSLEFSATLEAGWQRRATDPVGTVRRRIATHPTSAGVYHGRIKVYRWTRGEWHLVRVRRIPALSLQRALRWGGFHLPGLEHR